MYTKNTPTGVQYRSRIGRIGCISVFFRHFSPYKQNTSLREKAHISLFSPVKLFL